MAAQENKMNKDQQVIYGIHAVNEALMAGKDLSRVLIQKELKNDSVQNIIDLCKQQQVPFVFVPKEKFFFLKQKNHQGVCAFISAVTYQSLEQLVPNLFESGIDPFLLVLDRITDVRNLGAIARSALCSGVNGIVVPFTETAPVNEDAIKTSAGALHHLPVCREKLLKTSLEYLNQCGFKTIAITEKASDTLSLTDFTGPIALVMGNEEKGISYDVLKRCTHQARIPMDFGVSSLNVSVAAGIAMYEALCQRS